MVDNKLIEKYKQFVIETDDNPFDFLPETKTIDFPTIKEEEKAKFRVIGKNKAGCLVCTYLSDVSEELIVWLDSEGAPNAVFAKSMDEFFSILPYGTGFIYDVIVAILRGKNTSEDVCDRFADATTLGKETDKDLINIYEQTMNISTDKTPCLTIVKAINDHQQYFSKALNL